jgi:hypothetical protein
MSKTKKVCLFMIRKRGRFYDQRLVLSDFHRHPGPRISIDVVDTLELAMRSMLRVYIPSESYDIEVLNGVCIVRLRLIARWKDTCVDKPF